MNLLQIEKVFIDYYCLIRLFGNNYASLKFQFGVFLHLKATFYLKLVKKSPKKENKPGLIFEEIRYVKHNYILRYSCNTELYFAAKFPSKGFCWSKNEVRYAINAMKIKTDERGKI